MCDYVCELDAVGIKRARSELGEVESDRMAAVQAFRDWVLSQKDWLVSPTDAKFLLGFLRHRKFSQKAAKDRLIFYWKNRTKGPEWFSRLDTCSDEFQNFCKLGVFTPLPTRDRDGCRIITVRLGRADLKTPISTLIRANIIMMDAMFSNDMTQVCGIKILHDFTGVTLEHLIKLEGAFKVFAQIFLNAYPMRIRAICYYNVGAVFEVLFTMIRKFLPKKLRDRITTHKSLQTVYDIIDKSALPEEYLPDDYNGPNAGTIDTIIENYAAQMREPENRDLVARLSSGDFYCDVSKQPADVVPTESFRSLEI